jgi:tripeptide aminopeptidase
VNALDSVLDMFLELAAISSPSRSEREVADRVHGFLHQLGLETDEDTAGAAIGSDIGNIYCRIPASGEGTPIFLNAHLDTVPPTDRIEPVVEEGVVRNARDTILGADNKAAVVAMLAAVRDRVLGESPHAGLELVFTPCEEIGLQGAKQFDVSRLQAEFGYCYDHAAPIGQIVMAAPSQRTLRLTFRGRPSHSGIAPEAGRSAILAASRAIASMPLGRLDERTTTNVGLIEGGVAGNIVPPLCVVHAEARSRDPGRLSTAVQAILDACTAAAGETGCEFEAAVTREYETYRFAESERPVAMAVQALAACGYTPEFIESGGGADANVFNAAGKPCLNLCNGMAEIHTADEHITVDDLEAMTAVTAALIDRARDGDIAIADGRKRPD